MKKFPGEVTRGGYNNRQVIINDEQLEWLRTEYPKTESPRLAKAMKCHVETVRKLARLNGIEKSEAGLRAIRKRCNARMVKTNERNGCYDRKRGHALSEATMEGNRRRWAEFHAGLRESTFETLKRRDPKKYQALMEKRAHNRRELIRKEKLRMIYGLERKTNIKVVVLTPYKRSQTAHRHSALKRGYLLDADCSEGSPGRYVIYYDDKTQRSEKFEANCIKDGFRFERDQ